MKICFSLIFLSVTSASAEWKAYLFIPYFFFILSFIQNITKIITFHPFDSSLVFILLFYFYFIVFRLCFSYFLLSSLFLLCLIAFTYFILFHFDFFITVLVTFVLFISITLHFLNQFTSN